MGARRWWIHPETTMMETETMTIVAETMMAMKKGADALKVIHKNMYVSHGMLV